MLGNSPPHFYTTQINIFFCAYYIYITVDSLKTAKDTVMSEIRGVIQHCK